MRTLDPNELVRLLGLRPICLRTAGQLAVIAVSCPADFDGNGVAGAVDLAELPDDWGTCSK